jgi:hypothetical protein
MTASFSLAKDGHGRHKEEITDRIDRYSLRLLIAVTQ